MYWNMNNELQTSHINCHIELALDSILGVPFLTEVFLLSRAGL